MNLNDYEKELIKIVFDAYYKIIDISIKLGAQNYQFLIKDLKQLETKLTHEEQDKL